MMVPMTNAYMAESALGMVSISILYICWNITAAFCKIRMLTPKAKEIAGIT